MASRLQSVQANLQQGALVAAAADPASIGPVVLLANWTQPPDSGQTYVDAAAAQLDYLLNTAPRIKRCNQSS